MQHLPLYLQLLMSQLKHYLYTLHSIIERKDTHHHCTHTVDPKTYQADRMNSGDIFGYFVELFNTVRHYFCLKKYAWGGGGVVVDAAGPTHSNIKVYGPKLNIFTKSIFM